MSDYDHKPNVRGYMHAYDRTGFKFQLIGTRADYAMCNRKILRSHLTDDGGAVTCPSCIELLAKETITSLRRLRL